VSVGVVGFSGKRLQQARVAMGLTATSLADLIGVSKQAISRYESGADSPRQEVLKNIQSTLKQESHFFLRKPNDLHTGISFYRSMASATASARDKSEVWLTWVRELSVFLSHYIEFMPVDVPAFGSNPNPLRIGTTQIEVAAEELRKHWNLGDGPVSDLTSLSESRGFLVARHPMDAESLDAVSKWCKPEELPIIVLNADKNVAVRSRLDLGHEIGHMVLHRDLADYEFRKSSTFKLVEDQAFRFGAALLLPEHPFLDDLYSVSLDGLASLKPKWKVSIAMMIERLKHLGILNDEQHRRIRINYSARQWNRSEPLDNEIPVEQPTFFAKALKLLLDERIQTIEQIVINSGFSKEWIQRLLSVDLSPTDPIQPKILTFKNR
jgi:Zn-dependent peptidase ImmA (M78 family)/transcriptional regulator with XRE-family HTH domain